LQGQKENLQELKQKDCIFMRLKAYLNLDHFSLVDDTTLSYDRNLNESSLNNRSLGCDVVFFFLCIFNCNVNVIQLFDCNSLQYQRSRHDCDRYSI
jgi:hypothetical protein